MFPDGCKVTTFFLKMKIVLKKNVKNNIDSVFSSDNLIFLHKKYVVE